LTQLSLPRWLRFAVGGLALLALLIATAAPIVASLGHVEAVGLYMALEPLCHQLRERSWVFGDLSAGLCIRCYGVYIGSWSPAGYSTSYQGPTNFTLNVPAPVAFSGLQAATDPTTNNRVFTWDHIPGVSWYQFWVGTLGPTRTYSSNWYLAFDQGCLDDGICSVEIPPSLLPAGAQFSWFIRGWSTAGFTTGEVAQHWVTGPNFTP